MKHNKLFILKKQNKNYISIYGIITCTSNLSQYASIALGASSKMQLQNESNLATTFCTSETSGEHLVDTISFNVTKILLLIGINRFMSTITTTPCTPLYSENTKKINFFEFSYFHFSDDLILFLIA